MKTYHYELQEQRAQLMIKHMSETDMKGLLYRLEQKREKTDFEWVMVDILRYHVGDC